MPSVVELLLDSLDQRIDDLKVHEGDLWGPVFGKPLLEGMAIRYEWLPEPVLGISVVQGGRAGIAINHDLREPDRMNDHRYVQFHEFGHGHCGHEGMFAVWTTEGKEVGKPDRRRSGWQEREADIIAAYVLVRREVFTVMKGLEAEYIAAIIEVPSYLISLRQYVLARYGR